MTAVLVLIVTSLIAGLGLTVFDGPSFVAAVGTSALALAVWCMLREAMIRRPAEIAERDATSRQAGGADCR